MDARNLPDLLFESERRFGPRPAVAMRRGLGTETWSYRELAMRARLVASRLDAAGVVPGDRVLMLAPNNPELVATMFGVWMSRAVLVPIELRTPAEVVVRLRELAEPRLALVQTEAEGLEGLPSLSPLEAVGSSEPPRPPEDSRHAGAPLALEPVHSQP